ncbi:hypothetical protein NEAUS03_2423 [Nematocida ausubeli]|uniref:Uncharacterized protein n=1 Tax=Nematocida ausubeli (strain ATCC PRA-371 / ERTm2) TaxID=1913371 RepID=H8ZBD0_NEMA1|nr:uncharacterized protein NESG_01266 [Nematocida ausubeli]EHY66183.1 hypothetical protein NERG_00879 [Nematocida ausubeli]KAI5137129.1 hypothetical protein NEAUS06_2107 [Nematocida ausubeli]KAI5137152.1 hypothetical protein NEAUS06_2117 [Nematocida ausubeli]KAI5164071.1 hypothetical protein NEAUS03_2423 [Nematocida ausubeli]KFG26150.1 hypothetical protein NESG_01266 [Nematocida ausubeli]
MQDKLPINFLNLEIEPFTQKSFTEIINESFKNNLSHVIAKVFLKNEQKPVIYDARILCKYLFELIISQEGRTVRLKRVNDPINDKIIKDILFYEIPVRSKDGLDGKYIGNQKDFLESTSFRSKIFNRNDPFDSLSINFLFKDKKKVGRRPFLLIGISFTILCIIFLSCTYTVLHTSRLIDPIKKYLK